MCSAPIPDNLRESARDAYKQWGAEGFFEKIAERHMTEEALFDLLEEIEHRMSHMHCRLSPTSFEADDPSLRPLPRPRDPQWKSGERTMRHYASQGVMTRVPIFWQFGLSIHAACRSLGLPIFVNEPENIPVGAMSLKRGGIDTVVCENKDAPSLSSYIAEKSLPLPKLWILIHRIGKQGWDVAGSILSSPSGVGQEVHLFPGVVVLEQCETLSGGKSSHFHFSDSFSYEIDEHTFVTSVGDDPLPLYRYTLPCHVRATGMCTCGKEIIERL